MSTNHQMKTFFFVIQRLAKSLTHMKNIYTLLGEEDKVELITSVLQQLGLAIWLIYDNLMWAAKVGLIKNADTNSWLKRSNQAWLMAMLSAVIKKKFKPRQIRMSCQQKLITQWPLPINLNQTIHIYNNHNQFKSFPIYLQI